MSKFLRLYNIFLTVLFLFCASASATEVDLIYNLSGSNMEHSTAAWHGANVAAEMLKNADQPINMVLYNGESNPNINHAIAKMRVKANTTPLFLSIGDENLIKAAAKPILNAKKTLISATSMTLNDLQKLGPNFISVAPPLEKAAQMTSQFIKISLSQNAALVVFDPANPSSTKQTKLFKKIFTADNGQVKTIPTTPTQQLPQEIQAALTITPNSTIVLITSNNISMAKQLRAQRIKQNIVASAVNGLNATESAQLAHLTPIYFIQTTEKDSLHNQAIYQRFVNAFKKQYNKLPSPAAVAGYNSLMLANMALSTKNNANNTTSADAVRSILSQPNNELIKLTMQVFGVHPNGKVYQAAL